MYVLFAGVVSAACAWMIGRSPVAGEAPADAVQPAR
jgi:MHS family metabolite:H+ symporter-like MFS transporter